MAYMCESCPIRDNKAYSGICDMCKPHAEQLDKINDEFNLIMSWLKSEAKSEAESRREN